MYLMGKVPPPGVNRQGPVSILQLHIVIKTGNNRSLSVEYAKAKLFVHTVFLELYRWDKQMTTVGNSYEGVFQQIECQIIRASIALQLVHGSESKRVAVEIEVWDDNKSISLGMYRSKRRVGDGMFNV